MSEKHKKTLAESFFTGCFWGLAAFGLGQLLTDVGKLVLTFF